MDRPNSLIIVLFVGALYRLASYALPGDTLTRRQPGVCSRARTRKLMLGLDCRAAEAKLPNRKF
jgi:hypothetical protein